FWSREKSEYKGCEEDNIRPGTIDTCQREVDSKYGGSEFDAWRNAQEADLRAQWARVSAKIDTVTNSGPLSLTGRAIGSIFGEKWADVGGAAGSFGDGLTGVAAGIQARGNAADYNASGGLVVTGDAPITQTAPESGPAPTPDTEVTSGP